MKKPLTTVSLVALMTTLTACQERGTAAHEPALGSQQEVEAELREFEAAHEAAIDAKDIDACIAFYSPNLITIAAGEPIQRGREWIRPLMEEIYRTCEFHETFTLSDVRIMGDRVAATYQYSQSMTPLSGGLGQVVTGRGMGILKRTGHGAWQWEWNAYSADAPRERDREDRTAETPGEGAAPNG